MICERSEYSPEAPVCTLSTFHSRNFQCILSTFVCSHKCVINFLYTNVLHVFRNVFKYVATCEYSCARTYFPFHWQFQMLFIEGKYLPYATIFYKDFILSLNTLNNFDNLRNLWILNKIWWFCNATRIKYIFIPCFHMEITSNLYDFLGS